MSPSEKYKSLYQTRPTTPQNNADLTRPKTLADLMRERNSNATTPKVETVVEPEEKIPSKMFIGSDSISMPKPSDLSQSTLSEGERLLSDSNKMIKDSAARSRESLRQNFLFGEFLFGKSEDEYLGTKLPAENVETGFVKGLVDSVKSRGVIKFLQKNNLMQEAEKTNEYAGELMRQGNSKSDAITKSREYYAGNSNLLNDSEKTALKGLDNTRVLWGAVEVLDLFPIFKYARTTLGATYIRDVLKTAVEAPDALTMRDILIKNIPQLKNTKEADEAVSTIRTLQDPVKSESFIKDLVNGGLNTKTDFDTQAQQIFYDKGVPVLRGGAKSNADEIVSTRDEVNKVLRGEVEEARLSNLDVLQSEIKAGALPFKQGADEVVPVFTIRNKGRLGIGERVTLDRKLAESLAKSASDVRELSYKADDLVRLADGTFVYAPKAQVAKGLTPSLKSVVKGQRDKVAKIEADRVAQAVKVQKAEADAVIREQKAVESARRKAQFDAEMTKEKALRIMSEAPKQAIEKIAKLKVEKTEAIEVINATVRTANATLRSAQTKVDTLVRKIKDAPTVDLKKGYQEKLNAARKILDEAKADMPNKVDLEKQKLAIRTEYGTKIKATNAETRQAVKAASEGSVNASSVATTKTAKVITPTDSTINTIVQTLKPIKGNKGLIEPLQGGVTTTASAFAKRIKEEASDMLARVGGDISAIPEHHAVLTNEAQMAKAFEYVSANPEQAYLDFINANFKGETSRAAVYNVLTKTDFLKNDAVRMENVIRTFFKEGTRLAQELQARQIVGQLDYATIVGRLLNMSDTIAKKRGINLGRETEILIQKFGDTLDQIPTNSKSAITKAVDEITCK